MLIKMTCPQCGASMDFDDSREFMFCTYCGTKVANVAQNINIQQNVNVSGTVMHKTDYSDESNLIINYSTIHPGVRMVVAIPSLRQKLIFLNGHNMAFRLPEGRNVIVLKIGKINYKRAIFIDSTKPPVRIDASWSGRAQIYINTPTPV